MTRTGDFSDDFPAADPRLDAWHQLDLLIERGCDQAARFGAEREE